MKYLISILGVPIAKARPRFARRGRFVVTYNDQQTEEGRFLFEVQKQWKQKPLETAIKLSIGFLMPVPKSTSKKKSELMLTGKIKHTKRPDCSNLIKFVEDCLNGVAWKDDSQIYFLQGYKAYAENPQTIIKIEEDNGRNNNFKKWEEI